MSRRLRTVAALAVLVSLATGGCMSTDLERVDPGPHDDAPAGSERTEVGQEITTAEGNVVTVRRVASSVRLPGTDLLQRDVEVEICAADHDDATSSPSYFRALVEGEGYRRPAPPVRQPALDSALLEAGTCARGWLGFPIRPAEEVDAIVLVASSTVEWALG